MKNLYHYLANSLICLLILTLSSLNSYTQITVQTPNGGEVWFIGTNQDIHWTTEGTSGYVRLEYSANGGTDWFEIVSDIPDGGSYSWLVPSNPSTDCIVRVSDMDGDPVDVSDAAFVILPEALTGEYVTDANTMGLWHLNETGGATAYDFSGNGNNGSITGTTVGSGQFGSAREFYTASDQITVTNNESLNFGTGAYTIEFWVKAPPNSGGHPMHKRGNTTMGTTGRGWFTNIENNKIAISLYNDPTLDGEAGNCGIMSIRDVADDTWHHVAFVNTYESILCYIDGFLDSQAPIPWQGSPDNDGIMEIGVNSHTGEFLGALDEIRISNKARTPDEFSVNPGVRINAPNGGEFWQGGNEYLISWNSFGTSGNVTLEFSRNNGIGWATIEAGITDNGNYSWDVPNEPCTECLIRVADTDGDPLDVSDGVFTILDEFNPVATNPYVGSMHNINNNGSENYGIELYVNVSDPQGLDNIASVTATSPTGAVYTLFDNGQNGDDPANNGRYGIHIWSFTEAPPTGAYTFTVTDNEGHSAVTTDVLSMVIDVPRNTLPLHNAVVNTATPTFSWDGVPGATYYWIGVHDMQHNDVWSQNDINATSIVYNDNLSGSSLVEGQMYQWQVSTQIEDGRSWHEWSSFVYSSNTTDPFVTNPTVYSMHRGDDYGNEGYGLELYVNVADPQGSGDISSVTVTSPTGAIYSLYDNGQNGDDEANNGRYGIHIWEFNQTPPPFGTYTFTVTDGAGHITSASDALDNVIDYPKNLNPANNQIISGENLIFSWDDVPGAIEYGVDVRDINNNQIWSIAATTNSITYGGPAFTDGGAYRWNVGTSTVIDARSWHDGVTFIYSSDPDKPVITYTQVYAIHDRFTNGTEQYRLELNADVFDPQGIADVTMTVTAPGGEIYILYNDGQHGDGSAGDNRFANYELTFTEAPGIGNYTFTAMDGSSNTAIVYDPLYSIPEIPGNMMPANNGYISTSTPVYTWDAVPGATSYTIDVLDVNNYNIWNHSNFTTNSIEHNFNESGTDLMEGHIYRWQLQAFTDEGRSWQEWLSFVYSGDGISPVAENPSVQFRHWGRDLQYDLYGLELRVNASDPQGLANITSVIVEAPGGYVYTLYDDGQHNDNGANDGFFGNNIWNLPDAPSTGEYFFRVTNAQSQVYTVTDMLNNLLDIPRNLQPVNNSLVTTLSPTFSWNEVPGAANYVINVHDGTTQLWNQTLDVPSVLYNGPEFISGKTYFWNLSANAGDAVSWHDENIFVYSTDANSPVAVNPSVQSRHWGRDQVYENYGLELRLNVMDPQGLENIASVTVNAPGGAVYTLYDDGQHADNGAGDGYFGNNIWNLADAPVIGEYIFTVTDANANTISRSDMLDHVIDIPRNIQPAHNLFITTATPTFSWNEVPGATHYWINVSDGSSSIWSRGGITGTSIVYNDDGLGQALLEGKTYYLNVNAGLDDANSSHDDVTFTFSTDPDNPLASNPVVRSMHAGNDLGSNRYGLELYLTVADPQGLESITSVTVTSPTGAVYSLYDDGQHKDNGAGDGRFGNHIWELTEAPLTGGYLFTVMDNSGHSVTANDMLDNVIDFPRNIHPANNAVITSAEPELSWDAVQGVNFFWLNVRDANTTVWSKGDVEGTSIQYNNDGNGQPLVDGRTYYWSISTNLDDASSWHDEVAFVYASDPENPVASNALVRSMHRGDDQGNEGWALELYVTVGDPQGPGNIQTVTATSPDNVTYTLYDDGQNGDAQANDGIYGIHIWEFNEAPPPMGEYVFTATDKEGHTATASDNLDLIIDYPRNVQPANNTVVTSATPILSWNAVPGVSNYWVTVFDANNNNIWNQEVTGGTSVQYSGPALQQEVTYHWQVDASLDDSHSWHDWSGFAWSSDPDKPFIGNSGLWYRHYGDDEGTDQYYIELMARVNDPQGLDDIQSVTLNTPNLEVITLSRNDGDPGAWNGQWSSNQPPALGDYTYTVTDLAELTDTQIHALAQAQDFPRNVQPENNVVIANATPTFSWNAVDGIDGYNLTLYDANYNQVWVYNNFIENSVVYSGQPLTDGTKYYWDISTYGDHCATWHNMISFTYSINTENPLFTYANVFSMSHGNNAGSEHAGMRLMAVVNDPQGLSDIQSVTVTSPDFVTYTLYDDGQHGDDGAGDGRYGDYVWDPPQAALPGTYSFEVIDMDEHSGSISDMLDYTLDYPRTIIPQHNGVMVPASPVFSWNPVDYAESYTIYVYASNGWDVVWHKNGITGNSVQYNDDGSGILLAEGSSYAWEIFANGYDGQSWHELSNFVYRVNTDRIIRVNIANNSGTEDGSETFPYNTIQEGINASANGDTVLIWPGTYVENPGIVDRDIVLASLFINSGDENDVATTIIDGNHAATVLLVQNSDITIHGLTVQNGQASAYGAGGIQIEGGNSVVSHCIISGNTGIGQDEWGAGGITFNNGNLQINNCVISGNNSPGGAAGIRAGGAHVDLSNVLLADNSGNLAIHYNDVTGNITNSTIVNNTRAFIFNNSPIDVINSIEWNNNSDYGGNIGIVSYSCTQVPLNGTGVIHANPVFQDSYAGDFHLQMNSPCIDAGAPDMTDTDGSPIDMGYFGGQQGISYMYLDGPPVLNYVNVNPAYVAAGQQLTINASLFDAQTQVNSVTADIENPDETVIASVILYDDGAHSDNGAGDGIFGNSVTDNWTSGQHYFIDLNASDDNSNALSVNNAGGFDGITTPDVVNLPFTHETMNVNGLDDELVWNSITAVPVTKHHFGQIDNPEDLSASFKACWNLDSLFVLINVVDDSLDNIHGSQGWDNDKISLYLDMDNSRGSSYDINDWDMTLIWEGGFNPNRYFTGIRYIHNTNAQRDGYQLELALSLKDLGYPLAETLGFDLDIMDRDGEDPATALLFWNSEINMNYTNPSLNGIATLLDFDANMPDQALKVVDLIEFTECATGPAEVKVLITNFGTLTVEQFDIMYALNSDTIDPVETVNMIINPGDTVEYTFTTPAVLTVTGRYNFNISTLLNDGDPHANFALTTERMVFGTDAYDNWTTYSTCNGLPDNSTRFVMEDNQGNIWVGTSYGGAARLDHNTGTWEVFNSDNSGFSNNNAITIFEDSYGIIWVGLDGEDGIVRSYDGANWTSNNLGNVHVLTMFEDHAGNMWFGTWASNGIRKWERSTDTWTVYNTQSSGIPSHDMWYGAIMEDEENNMWFGTISGGLLKFNGTNWTVYNTSNSGIPDDLVVGSLMDHNGDIWLAHGWNNRGVTRFDGSYFQNYNTGNSGLTSDFITNIFEDHNGNLWFGSWDNGVSKFNGTIWTSFNMDNSGLTSNSVNSITEDINGDIWFATSNGLCKFDAPDQAIKVIDVVDFPACGTADAAITVRLLNTGTVTIDQFDITYSINGTSIDPAETAALTLIPGDTVSYTFSTHADLSAMGNYTLYVTTLLNGGDPLANESLETERFVFGSDTWEDWISYNMCNGMPAGNVRYVLEDSQGNIWAALNGTGVARLDKLTGTWTLFNSDNSGFDNNAASALCEDHLGNIWVGLDGTAAVAMFDGTSWTFNNPENIHVLTIMEDHTGNMWFGTWGYGVRKWDRASDTWTTYTTANSGLPSNDMWYGAIMEDSENNMWFATLAFSGTGGLAKFDGTDWENFTMDNSGLPSNMIWGSMLDSQDNIWLGHSGQVNGATKFDGENWTTYNTTNSGIVSDNIYNFYEDRDGNVWFGSWGQGVSKFDGTDWENFTMDNSGLTSNGINSIGQDHEGNMWFGTGRGIDKYIQGTVPPETHFVTVWEENGHDHMNFYATAATIDGVPMQAGDEIGIFDGNICVGAGLLTGVIDGVNYFEIRVSRDESTTPEIDGYTVGNLATFKLWDSSEEMELSTYNITYAVGSNIFDIGASTWYQIDGFVQLDQEISLTIGWNIFSLFVTPDDTAMMSIVQPLIDEGSLIKVQNESGAAIEQIPGFGIWLNNIHYWRKTEGYKIRVNESTTLTVTGRPVTQPVSINLLGGWNIIGYPSSASQVAMTALDELISAGNLRKVQSETGAAIEPLPLNMGWIDNIHDFMPGEGYKVRVTVADVLTITPSEIAGGLKSAGAELLPQHYRANWTGNGYDHMNVYLTEMSEVSNLQPGDEIAVFDGDVCVGASVIGYKSERFISLAVSADDPATTEIDGFVKGNTMNFRIWRAADNSETYVNSVRFYTGYTDIFEPMGTTVAGLSIPANGMSELTTSFGDNYPNPFVLETTFNFTLGETMPVNITLYNLLGEKVKILVSQTMEGGSYSTVWDATDNRGNRVTPGIYICKMIAGDYVGVKTVELLR